MKGESIKAKLHLDPEGTGAQVRIPIKVLAVAWGVPVGRLHSRLQHLTEELNRIPPAHTERRRRVVQRLLRWAHKRPTR